TRPPREHPEVRRPRPRTRDRLGRRRAEPRAVLPRAVLNRERAQDRARAQREEVRTTLGAGSSGLAREARLRQLPADPVPTPGDALARRQPALRDAVRPPRLPLPLPPARPPDRRRRDRRRALQPGPVPVRSAR